jgi:hypothetical protein
MGSKGEEIDALGSVGGDIEGKKMVGDAYEAFADLLEHRTSWKEDVSKKKFDLEKYYKDSTADVYWVCRNHASSKKVKLLKVPES